MAIKISELDPISSVNPDAAIPASQDASTGSLTPRQVVGLLADATVVPEKNSIINNDVVFGGDSAAGFAPKFWKWSTLISAITSVLTIADGAITYVKLATAAIATVANWRGNAADKLLTPNAVWDSMAEVSLTDAAPIAWDLSTGFDFTVTLGGNRTINASGGKVGQKGRLRVVQDSNGTRTLTKGTNIKTPGGANPTIATGNGAVTILYYDCRSATEVFVAGSPQAWS